jgi:hypothetical protein
MFIFLLFSLVISQLDSNLTIRMTCSPPARDNYLVIFPVDATIGVFNRLLIINPDYINTTVLYYMLEQPGFYAEEIPGGQYQYVIFAPLTVNLEDIVRLSMETGEENITFAGWVNVTYSCNNLIYSFESQSPTFSPSSSPTFSPSSSPTFSPSSSPTFSPSPKGKSKKSTKPPTVKGLTASSSTDNSIIPIAIIFSVIGLLLVGGSVVIFTKRKSRPRPGIENPVYDNVH